MSTTCASKPYVSTPALNFPTIEESKSWVLADVSNDIVKTEEDANDVRKRILDRKKKFHQDRKLLVKHLPRNVQKQEIAELLFDFHIKSIHLANNDDKSSTATVTLENSEVLDEWDNDRRFLLREQSVSVSPTPTEMLLCIARLPFHYTEDDFLQLIKEYSEVKMYFLMISERTGKSKGYGFVQYANKEQASIARNALNGKTVDTFQLVCDWLDSSHLTFNSLHSKCLYVDNLPKPFRDMSEFRAIFERIINPPYCQIALKKGCPLDWGLVEYLKAEDAELAQTSCHNYRLRNQSIRIVYYIPGVRAINLMLSLLDTPPRGKSAGLLPDPTGHSIRMSIKNLSKQNPIFAENLKNIILHQIHESKQGDEKPQTVEKLDPAPAKDIEKIVPPTPPMTPTIMNGMPIINSNLTVPVTTVPLLPNTAVPPPGVDKMGFPQLSKEKFPVLWNDMFSASLQNVYQPLMPGALTPESGPPSFAITPTSLVHELMNLPLNVPQNIYNLIGSPSMSPAMPVPVTIAHTPAATPVSISQNISYPPLSIDPLRILQNAAHEALISPSQIQQQLMIPTSWPSISPFMTPTNIPVFTTSAAAVSAEQWHTLRMPPTVVVSSQPSTPVVHHYTTGQKRKLLPSPEKSPEGNYIGQHSQGIGGHYADSYFKKKKMF